MRLKFFAIDGRDHPLGVELKNQTPREQGTTEMDLHASAGLRIGQFGELLCQSHTDMTRRTVIRLRNFWLLLRETVKRAEAPD